MRSATASCECSSCVATTRFCGNPASCSHSRRWVVSAPQRSRFACSRLKRVCTSACSVRAKRSANPIPTSSRRRSTGSDRASRACTRSYLLFNEGYLSVHADSAIRRERRDEAIRLAMLLAEHPVGDVPETFALLALMKKPHPAGSCGTCLMQTGSRDRRCVVGDELKKALLDASTLRDSERFESSGIRGQSGRSRGAAVHVTWCGRRRSRSQGEPA